ncbi:MAG: hypothetical protein Q7V31_12140 [Parvibaculum sp.]|uniref:hypothetical protein n=1 Tax=Parvibaculum sp. TaxID=2024848 RepID=UPI00271D5D4C|nr:hypothetical protein [Parvibaculum sp.]MDO8839667.1 hypothetical protein [Parvibaculum sp.]
MQRPAKRTSDPRQRAKAAGYRSGLEEVTAQDLTASGAAFEFETFKVAYTVPERRAKYTPDFLLLFNGIIVETKGRFVTADRQKHILLKEQHPDIDIRFVFSNPSEKISKTSKTTYAMWCQKHGFKFARKRIPPEWLAEPPEPRRFAAIEKAKSK